ncbi:hypothetical protein AB5N96_08100 [Chryseomicrobium imtechense]
MYRYGISKYDPRLRDKSRRYFKEDWTGVGDIGKVYEGEKLTVSDYLKVEDTYVSVIEAILTVMNIPKLHVTNLRRVYSLKELWKYHGHHEGLYDSKMIDYFSRAEGKKVVKKQEVETLIRLLLREDLTYLRMGYKDDLTIIIGYDYLMAVETSVPIDSVISEIEQKGLFVE